MLERLADRGLDPDPERDFWDGSVRSWLRGSPFTRFNLPKVHCKGKLAFVIYAIAAALDRIDRMKGDFTGLMV